MKTGMKTLAAAWLSLPLMAMADKGVKTPGVDSIDIYYEATVLQPTCTVQIKGASVTDNGTDRYTLTLGNAEGKVTLSDVRNGQAKSDFQLVLLDDAQQICSKNVADVDISLSGTVVSGNSALLDNLTAGGAQNVGLGFYLRDDASRKMLEINSGEAVIDTPRKEMENGVWLTALLLETSSGQGTKGPFSARTVFSFDYK